MDPHSEYSALRESILEHAFLGALGCELWRKSAFDMEILQAEVDSSGYDVVLTVGKVTRHIQLKAKLTDGSTRTWPISERLAEKPSGCVVVIYIDRETLEISHFGFFGGAPGKPFPDITNRKKTRHTKADSTGTKSERKHHRVIAESQFIRVPGIAELVVQLIGD